MEAATWSLLLNRKDLADHRALQPQSLKVNWVVLLLFLTLLNNDPFGQGDQFDWPHMQLFGSIYQLIYLTLQNGLKQPFEEQHLQHKMLFKPLSLAGRGSLHFAKVCTSSGMGG